MTARTLRAVALAAGAGALVLATAAPAMADDTGLGASKLSIPSGTAATNYPVPLDPANPANPCPADVTTWTAKTASKNMKAIVVAPAASCANGVVTVNVAAPAGAKKKNAVIKVIGTNTNDATVKVVKTIVVKVTGVQGNPGKGPKS